MVNCWGETILCGGLITCNLDLTQFNDGTFLDPMQRIFLMPEQLPGVVYHLESGRETEEDGFQVRAADVLSAGREGEGIHETTLLQVVAVDFHSAVYL